jgi:hypothetical protein
VRKKGWQGKTLIAFFDTSSSLSVRAAIKDIQEITVAPIAEPRLYFL